MDGNFSDVQHMIKYRQKLDSFADHLEQHFKSTTSRTNLCNWMAFKVVNKINQIGEIKSFTKPNCNLCIQECLTVLKKLRYKRVTLMNKSSDI